MTRFETHGTKTPAPDARNVKGLGSRSIDPGLCFASISSSGATDVPEDHLISSLAICGIALMIEAFAGYPAWLFGRIGHPVTWIGAFLDYLDLHRNIVTQPDARRRAQGMFALALLLAATGGAAVLLQSAAFLALPRTGATLFLGIVASSCLAQRSLDMHVRAVADALERKGIDAARRAVGAIVGRDTAALDEAGVARAAIESLAENFADGVVAPAFWLALLGLPGGLLYKAANTADSMIGHRTPRHAAFGFAAAKFDDAVNWVPARLAAVWLLFAVLPAGRAGAAWRVMRRDASGHLSPNAGWPEAAMAGALGLRLGGPRVYAGTSVPGAFIGDGNRAADATTIRDALTIYRTACVLQIAAFVGLALVIARWR